MILDSSSDSEPEQDNSDLEQDDSSREGFYENCDKEVSTGEPLNNPVSHEYVEPRGMLSNACRHLPLVLFQYGW